MEFVSEELEGEALRWLRRHDELPYSFVDATSFAVLRTVGLTEVLTFDDGFAAAGFHIPQAPEGGVLPSRPRRPVQ